MSIDETNQIQDLENENVELRQRIAKFEAFVAAFDKYEDWDERNICDGTLSLSERGHEMMRARKALEPSE